MCLHVGVGTILRSLSVAFVFREIRAVPISRFLPAERPCLVVVVDESSVKVPPSRAVCIRT
jgi:hypothetical protein